MTGASYAHDPEANVADGDGPTKAAIARAIRRGVANGKPDREIAEELGLSTRTIKRIRARMGVVKRKTYPALTDAVVRRAATDGRTARDVARDMDIPWHIVRGRFADLGFGLGPRGDDHEPRDATLQVRVTVAERDAIHAAAAAEGMDLSTFVRSRCLP